MSHAWMPLYVADYIADTGHLSTLEHGAYLLLIMHYWQRGSLPKDDRKLSIICKIPERKWRQIRSTIYELFDAEWHHKRIDAELKKANEIMVKRHAASKAGVAARQARRTENGTEDSDHVVDHVVNDWSTQPQPHKKDSSDTSVGEAAREASRKSSKNGTASVCRVTYSEAERKALAFEFDGLDVDQAIDELDRWCDRKLINDPIDRKSAIYGGLRKRHGKAKLADSMNSPELVVASPELSASKLTRKRRVNGKHPGVRR